MTPNARKAGEPHVLHVEGSDVDARLTAVSIGRTDAHAAKIERVRTLAEALASIHDHKPAAILLDLDLPDSKGLHTLGDVVRAAGPRVPVIVFTGTYDLQIKADALRAGARLYLAKDEAEGSTLSTALRDAIDDA